MFSIPQGPMRIAMIAGCYPPDIRGGGEISSQLLAGILQNAGCDVHVITCGEGDKEEMDGEVHVSRIRSPNIYWNFNATPTPPQKLIWHARENFNPTARSRLISYFNRIKPDLVLTSTIENFGAEAWHAPAHAKLPSIHILRSYYPFCWRGSAVRNGSNCSGACLDCAVLTAGRKRASRRVNGVIGISRYVLERHEAQGFFPSASTAIIPEPIKLEDTAMIRERSRLDGCRFGYLGVLSSDKGLETLAAAWDVAKLDNVELRIGGTGTREYERTIRQLFHHNVTFDGWVDSRAFLAGLDFLIVPSIWNEPFGRIVIEAFAAGVPVIGSRIGGVAETIEDGVTGFTFTPGDHDSLARLIRKCSLLSAVAYQHLSQQASKSVLKYRADTIGNSHLQFYEDVIQKYKSEARVGQV